MINKILLLLLFACLISVSGCYLLDTKTNKAGKEVTKLEDIFNKIEAGIKPVAPIVNTFVPGVGTIATGLGGLLGLIGSLVTSIVVAKRRGGALEAVIAGVEAASNKDTKVKIKEVAGVLGVEPFLNKIVKKYSPV